MIPLTTVKLSPVQQLRSPRRPWPANLASASLPIAGHRVELDLLEILLTIPDVRCSPDAAADSNENSKSSLVSVFQRRPQKRYGRPRKGNTVADN